MDSNKVLDKKTLMATLKLEFPDIPDATINWRLHQLKELGVIQSMGYGKYALTELKNYVPDLSSSIKRIHNKILKELPYTTFCVWESKWFNEFMLHQLFKNYQVVEVEKESVEAVFNTLTDFSKKVFLNPTTEIYLRYIANFDEVIIVKTLVSESPIVKTDDIWVASLEKLLVDCLVDKELFAAQQNELDFIFKSVFSKYTLSISKMTRYARRRGHESELGNFINKFMA
ncbi:MAG: DUF6577 family protein [Cytophagales bacterium]